MKPDRRFVESGSSGHIYFIGRPCTVCGKSLGKKGKRVIWEIRNGYMRGDDSVYGCHEHCEPKMAEAINSKTREGAQ